MALILVSAFALDMVLGDPVYPLHPVRLIGRLASILKKCLFDVGMNGKLTGILVTVIMLLLPVNVYIALRVLLESLHPMATSVLDIFVLYSCIALKDMVNHARPIAASLSDNNIEQARIQIQKIVGRDSASLDAHGIARGAVESVAESFVDGFMAPVFWYTAAAMAVSYFFVIEPAVPVCAALVYRTSNTMDSMIGYKSEELINFGWFAARLDDVLNYLPARLSILFLFIAAFVCRLNPLPGLKITMRDRLKHSSPNSGHPESFVAGALALKLGGPAIYPDGMVEKPWIGDGTADALPGHIYQACRLSLCAGLASVIVSSIILVLI